MEIYKRFGIFIIYQAGIYQGLTNNVCNLEKKYVLHFINANNSIDSMTSSSLNRNDHSMETDTTKESEAELTPSNSVLVKLHQMIPMKV